jgi:trimeric autotransporter adhesin
MKRTILNLLIYYCAFGISGKISAQLSGTYSVPGSFSSIAVALNNLNIYGVSGSVTINIASGYTETAVSGGYSLYPVVGSSSLNTVTFRKNGTGANPIIYAYTGVSSSTAQVQDGVWRIIGADFITIDHINITDLNTSNPATMEFGLGFYKAGPNDGCQYNTVSNCVISLRRINNYTSSGSALGGSRAIDVVNTLVNSYQSTGMAAVSTNAGNSFNKFYGNLIQDCNYGIAINSIISPSIPLTYSDSSNDIGGTSAVTGNTIINYGGGGTLSPAGAIYVRNQQEINISNNLINNNNGSGVSHAGQNLYGIFSDQSASANATIQNNTVTVKSSTNCTAMYAIYNAAGNGAANNTVSVTGNLVSNAFFANNNAHFYGIYNTAAVEHLFMTGNTFSNNVNNQSVSGDTYLLRNTGAVRSTVNISDNIATHSVSVFGGYSGNLEALSSIDGTTNTAVTFSNNTFPGLYIASLNSPKLIHVTGNNLNLRIQNNSWNNLSMNLFGGITVMYNSSATYSTAVITGNSITNFTNNVQTGDFSGYWGSSSSSSTSSITISSNTLSNITYTYYNGSGGFIGIAALEGSVTPFPYKEISNNLISNISFSHTGDVTGMFIGMLGDGGQSTSSAVHHNTISNISSRGNTFGLQTYSVVPPALLYPHIYSNIIHSVVCTNTQQAIGVQINQGVSGLKFYKNKITNVTNTGSVMPAWGLYSIQASKVDIYNNIIGDINAPLSGNQNASVGIYLNGGNNCLIYYNTVYLSGNAYGSNCIQSASSTTVDIRNNIFVNLSAGNGTTTAFRRSSNLMTSYDLSSNNNLFYAGTPGTYKVLLAQGNSNYQTIAQVKQNMQGREMNSVSENVPFASTTSTAGNYLNINGTVTTQVESGAQPISWITDDFYGNPRNANFPDIGAVEGNYTLPLTDNLSPTLKSFGFSTYACGLSGRTFTAEISDKSGVATGSLSPKLYYYVNFGSFTSAQGTLSSGTSTSGIWSFNLSYAASYGDVISWYLQAQDIASTPNVVTWPPGLVGVNSYTITMPLGGTYSVGTGGTFTSLTAAADAYNIACLTGPVTFVLTNTLYSSSTETFPVVFMNNSDASATNSLLIVPAASTTVLIQGTSSGTAQVLKMLNARYITVDGLNSGGSALTVQNTNTALTVPTILIASSNVADPGCRFVSVRNLSVTSFPANLGIGIAGSFDNMQLISQGGLNNNFISITDNTVHSMVYGILASGPNSNPHSGSNNWLIANNLITGSTSLGSPLGFNPGAILIMNMQDFSIVSNTIAAVSYSTAYTYGIHCNMVNTGTISSNVISNLSSLSGGSSVVGIELTTGTINSNILVSNNMISAIAGWGFSNMSIVGIRLGKYTLTGGVKLLNNSIATNMGSVSIGQQMSGACISLANYASYPITIKNNLLYSNTYNSGSNGSRFYCLHSTVTNSVVDEVDYNNYYAEGSQDVMGYIASSTYTNLAAMQAGFGQNLNSVSMDPAFTSSVNLHIDPTVPANSLLKGYGIPLTQVPIDIDSQTRSLSNPDIGADEFTVTANCNSASGGILSPASYTVCSTTSLALSSNSVSGGAGINYQWQSAPTPTGSFSNLNAGTGITAPNYNSAGLLSGGVYYIRLNTSCPSASLSGVSNIVTVNVVASPTLNLTQTDTAVCAGNSATLSASGANTFSWSTGALSSSIVVTPTTSGYYSVYYGNSPCTFSTSNNIALYFSQNPTVTANASPTIFCTGGSVTLSASGASNYTWSSGANTASTIVNPTGQTVYTVTGSLPNGCTSSKSVAVVSASFPIITISQSAATVCVSSPVTFTASGAATYTWTGIGTGSLANVTPTANSIYTVNGSSAVGCISSNTVAISTLSLPVISVTPFSATVCAQTPVNFTASGAATYTWINGGNNSSQTYTPLTSGFFTVTGTEPLNGCIGSRTFQIVANPLPVISISATPSAFCSGGSSTLTASGAVSYTWSNGSNGGGYVVSPSVTTLFYVNGTSSLGCTSADSLMLVVHSLPQVNLSPASATICAGDSLEITASGANSYTWLPTGQVASTIKVSPDTSIIYIIQGTDINGCHGQGFANVSVDACTNLSEIQGDHQGIYLYPNPSFGKLIAEFNFDGRKFITVITSAGQELLSLETLQWEEHLDLSAYAKGLYFVSIHSAGKQMNFRIIVE